MRGGADPDNWSKARVTHAPICFPSGLAVEDESGFVFDLFVVICGRYRTRCPLCCFLDSHFVVSVTPFAVSVAHFVEMYSHFVDSVTHFVVSDQQSGNVYFQNVIRRPEC